MLVEIVDNAIINHKRAQIPFLTWAGIAFSFTSAVSEWNKYETNWMKKIIAAILLHITKALPFFDGSGFGSSGSTVWRKRCVMYKWEW